MEKLKTYKKDLGYSYALGASPTIELLNNRPKDCFCVIFSPDYVDRADKIKNMCEKCAIPFETNQKLINILSPKENCYVIAAFKKQNYRIAQSKSHVLLDNPSDMGNLGTIMRSCAGFGVYDIAIVGNGADAYSPKAIRASMGAFFCVNIEYFKTIDDYLRLHEDGRDIYVFMLKADNELSCLSVDKNKSHTLIFGNEAFGLDFGAYKNIGKSVVIRHTDKIDSLSLPVAAGIALFWFARFS